MAYFILWITVLYYIYYESTSCLLLEEPDYFGHPSVWSEFLLVAGHTVGYCWKFMLCVCQRGSLKLAKKTNHTLPPQGFITFTCHSGRGLLQWDCAEPVFIIVTHSTKGGGGGKNSKGPKGVYDFTAAICSFYTLLGGRVCSVPAATVL